MKSARLHCIDILRGIAIFLVVFGHVTRNATIHDWIFSFHVPIFFFISGFLFLPERYPRFLGFLGKKARALLVPYLLFAAVSLVYYWAFEVRIRPIDIPFWKTVWGVVYGSYTPNLYFNGALWFLPTLFSAEVLFWVLARCFRPRWLVGASALVLCALGVWYKDAGWTPPPLGVDRAFRYLPFLAGGFLARPWLSPLLHGETHRPALAGWLSSLVLCACCIALQVLLPKRYSYPSFGATHPEHVALYLLLGFVGIALAQTISAGIRQNRVLEYLGRNSLVFYAFQEQTYRLLLGVAARGSGHPVEALRTNLPATLAVTIATFLVLVPVVYLYNRRKTVHLGSR